MSIIKRFYNKFSADRKKRGFLYASQRLVQNVIGINSIEEQLDTLRYFNSIWHDCSAMLPTTDQDLRLMQKCDAVQLLIFDKLCKKHGLTYWLDYGTLLGAVRHKGFIPWDDDMDVAMPRADYDKLLSLVGDFLKQNDFHVTYDASRIGIGYQHSKTGVWLDVFPVDEIERNVPLPQCIDSLRSNIRICNRKSASHLSDFEKCATLRKQYLTSDRAGQYKILCHGPEFKYTPQLVHQHEDVFPLSTIVFEGVEFCAPYNPDVYLRGIYGDNYMGFPSSGVLHHGEATGRPPLSKWARLNGVDINAVLEKLTAICGEV